MIFALLTVILSLPILIITQNESSSFRVPINSLTFNNEYTKQIVSSDYPIVMAYKISASPYDEFIYCVNDSPPKFISDNLTFIENCSKFQNNFSFVNFNIFLLDLVSGDYIVSGHFSYVQGLQFYYNLAMNDLDIVSIRIHQERFEIVSDYNVTDVNSENCLFHAGRFVTCDFNRSFINETYRYTYDSVNNTWDVFWNDYYLFRLITEHLVTNLKITTAVMFIADQFWGPAYSNFTNFNDESSFVINEIKIPTLNILLNLPTIISPPPLSTDPPESVFDWRQPINSNLTINGSIFITSDNTLTINAQATIFIIGCVHLDGELLINTSTSNPQTGIQKFSLMQASCFENQFKVVRVIGLPDCLIYSDISQSFSDSYFFVAFVLESNCNNFPVSVVIGVVVAVFVIALVAAVALKFLFDKRKKNYAKSMSMKNLQNMG